MKIKAGSDASTKRSPRLQQFVVSGPLKQINLTNLKRFLTNYLVMPVPSLLAFTAFLTEGAHLVTGKVYEEPHDLF